eukprot:14947478-Ditylum_brightwellii.AAC.1
MGTFEQTKELKGVCMASRERTEDPLRCHVSAASLIKRPLSHATFDVKLVTAPQIVLGDVGLVQSTSVDSTSKGLPAFTSATQECKLNIFKLIFFILSDLL